MKRRIDRALKALTWALIRSGSVPAEVASLQKLMEHAYLHKLLKKLDVDCVIDVGANRGYFAQHLRQGGFKGHILCFEPIRANCNEIEQKARGDKRWKVVNVALGAVDGMQTFNVIKTGEQNVLSSFLNLREAEVLNSFVTLQNEHERTHTEEVRVCRLDAILPELLPKDEWQRIFLKMDTQGYDLKVFEGSRGILPHVVSLQSEISVRPLYHDMPSYRESLRVYEEAGFGVMNLFVVNRTNNGAILEYDCLMARDGAGSDRIGAP